MAKTNMLRQSDRFPALTVALPGHRTLRLPDALLGHFGGILLYRGSWCPYCNAPLSAFQRSLGRLARLDVSVAALSVDDEATTQALIAKRGLRFPVGHSADARVVAAGTGPSSTTTRSTISPPASCSAPAAGSSSACIPTAPSDGSSPTSLAWSATSATTPAPARPCQQRPSLSAPAEHHTAVSPVTLRTGMATPGLGHMAEGSS
jgi:peroxiredoxin